MPTPVSIPKGRILALSFRMTRSQTLKHQLLKVCKYIQSCGTESINPDSHQSQVVWRCPPVAVTKTGAPDECISSLLGDTGELAKASCYSASFQPARQRESTKMASTAYIP